MAAGAVRSPSIAAPGSSARISASPTSTPCTPPALPTRHNEVDQLRLLPTLWRHESSTLNTSAVSTSSAAAAVGSAHRYGETDSGPVMPDSARKIVSPFISGPEREHREQTVQAKAVQLRMATWAEPHSCRQMGSAPRPAVSAVVLAMSTVKSCRFRLLIPITLAFNASAPTARQSSAPHLHSSSGRRRLGAGARFISGALATSTSGSIPIARDAAIKLVSCSSVRIAT